jgi:hypothetical protein
MPSARRRLLLAGPSFKGIVCQIRDSASIASVRRERVRSHPSFYRPVIVLKLPPTLVDLFHNFAAGYRAQYYCGVRMGEWANTYAVRTVAVRVRQLVDRFGKRTCPSWWVARSLMNSEAKLWIHQGAWLRHAKRSDRLLRVQRWLCDTRPWAALTPHEESRLVVKGAPLTLRGTPLARSLKPSRAAEIHERGFT